MKAVAGQPLRFDSLAELYQWIEDTPQLPGSGNAACSNYAAPDWDLGVGFNGAMEIARNGGQWEQGATMLRKGMAQAANLREQSTAPAITYDVAGFMPDVPAYLAGVPENMMRLADDGQATAQTPIVSVCVPNAAGAVDAGHIFNRGIAVCTLIDVLEAAGTRVEANVALGTVPELDATVTIKRASDQWSPNAMAFGLGHPATIRRLGFAVRERHPDSLACTSNGGYGSGGVTNPDQYTVSFPRLMNTRNTWDTVANALRTTEALAAKAGLTVTLIDKE